MPSPIVAELDALKHGEVGATSPGRKLTCDQNDADATSAHVAPHATSGSGKEWQSRTARHAEIARYYDYTTPFYRVFWQGPTGAIHYGLRDRWTRSANDELLNTNRCLARIARVERGTTVLDAGCGVGGSAVWLAANLGARVLGLTLSARQAEKVADRAQRYGVADQVAVLLRDYEDTRLPAASFDVVWAIESVCYAADKRRFLEEAFRVLAPGGRLIVADGFLRRRPRPGQEAVDYAAFAHGLVLPGLALVREFMHTMRDVGFARVRRWDKTDAATPSSQRMYRRCLAGYPLAVAGQAIGLTPALLTDNIRAGIVQFGLVTGGIITYSVVAGEKPHTAVAPMRDSSAETPLTGAQASRLPASGPRTRNN